ncbi:MAG: 30S ribosomal protein S8 [Patescibacteria group bacterium]|nr:30S ribosomal protein S8 [Patescibacteria group bacterium]
MDPVADMFSGIKNAQARKHSEAVFPYSNLKFEIAKLLKAEGYLENVKKISNGDNKFNLKLALGYDDNEAKITDIKRVSKPGCRVYKNHRQIKKVLNGVGMAVISTSHGILTDDQARRKKIGGEIICEIY